MILVSLLASAFGLPIATWDFEEGFDGATVTSALQWEWGEFPLTERPEASGRYGWATQLSAHYRNDATDSLQLNGIDIVDLLRPTISLRHWYAIEGSSLGDAGWVEAQTDGAWVRLEPVYGYPSSAGFSGFSDELETAWFDLSGVDPPADLRFVFSADLAVSLPGWFIDSIELHDGDAVPPRFIGGSLLPDTTALDTDFPVAVEVIDDQNVTDVTLWWSENGSPAVARALTQIDDRRFEGHIEGQQSGTDIMWWVTASDGFNTTQYPASGTHRFRVALPPPENLQADSIGDTRRIAARTLAVSWSPPQGSEAPDAYEVTRDSALVATADGTSAVVPLTDGWQSIAVRGVFTTDRGPAFGDTSAPLEINVAYPIAYPPQPNAVWPGDLVRVTVRGEHLYLTAEDRLVASRGVSESTMDIIHANEAIALLAIDADAEPGQISLDLETDRGSIPLAGPLTVLSPGERPRVVAIRPPTARQGASLTLFVDLGESIDAEGIDFVDLGTGVFVQDVRPRATGFDVDIEVDGAAPIGERDVFVDTGARILRGATLRIIDNRSPTETGCSTAPTRTLFAPILLALIVLARQRKTALAG